MFVIVKMMEGELSDSLLADINIFPVFLSYFLPHTFSKETLKHKQFNYCFCDITYCNCWSSHYDADICTPCKVIPQQIPCSWQQVYTTFPSVHVKHFRAHSLIKFRHKTHVLVQNVVTRYKLLCLHGEILMWHSAEPVHFWNFLSFQCALGTATNHKNLKR